MRAVKSHIWPDILDTSLAHSPGGGGEWPLHAEQNRTTSCCIENMLENRWSTHYNTNIYLIRYPNSNQGHIKSTLQLPTFCLVKGLKGIKRLMTVALDSYRQVIAKVCACSNLLDAIKVSVFCPCSTVFMIIHCVHCIQKLKLFQWFSKIKYNRMHFT